MSGKQEQWKSLIKDCKNARIFCKNAQMNLFSNLS